jgi:Protein of unknown function (DUF3010)
MKTCGIEIDKDTLRFILLEEKNETLTIIQVKDNFFTLKDTATSKGLKDFKEVIYSFLDSQAPDKVAIISRLSTGKLASSGISFKIEAVLQLYQAKPIELIALTTINSFLKKDKHNLQARKKNQENSLNLAFYLIKN